MEELNSRYIQLTKAYKCLRYMAKKYQTLVQEHAKQASAEGSVCCGSC